MFDYTLVHWITFLSAAVLLNISPGPDIAFILGQTLRNGRQHGLTAMLGIWTGAGLHVLMAVAGLSAILATSAVAFTVVKWLGAGYLIYLGIQMLRSGGSSLIPSDGGSAKGASSVYWQGVLVCTLNPKVAVFFVAFLPQFVVEGTGPASAQLLLHGLLIIAVAACIEPPIVVAGARLGNYLRRHPRVGLWMDRGLGALFVGLGLRLAASTR